MNLIPDILAVWQYFALIFLFIGLLALILWFTTPDDS
jgi:hypothetical protein